MAIIERPATTRRAVLERIRRKIEKDNKECEKYNERTVFSKATKYQCEESEGEIHEWSYILMQYTDLGGYISEVDDLEYFAKEFDVLRPGEQIEPDPRRVEADALREKREASHALFHSRNAAARARREAEREAEIAALPADLKAAHYAKVAVIDAVRASEIEFHARREAREAREGARVANEAARVANEAVREAKRKTLEAKEAARVAKQKVLEAKAQRKAVDDEV